MAITGTWQAAPPKKEQPYELKAMAVKIIGAADAEVSKTLNLSAVPASWLLSSCQDRDANKFYHAEVPYSKEISKRRIPPNHPTSKTANSLQCSACPVEVRV